MSLSRDVRTPSLPIILHIILQLFCRKSCSFCLINAPGLGEELCQGFLVHRSIFICPGR